MELRSVIAGWPSSSWGPRNPTHGVRRGRWMLSYNGEVYDYREIRRRLAGDGAVFRGGSDTEVLVQAIDHWGLVGALDAVEGVFSLRCGTTSSSGSCTWSRTVRGEAALGWVGATLCLRFGVEGRPGPRVRRGGRPRRRGALSRHSCVPAPRTIYRGELLPADGYLWDSTRNRARLHHHTSTGRPANSPAARRQPAEGSSTELTDQLEAVLSDSVAARMVADVPVGAFLSGGVDSTTVVALMQQHSRRQVRTFTIGFANRLFDDHAAAVAAHLGTDHTPLTVSDAAAADIIPSSPTPLSKQRHGYSAKRRIAAVPEVPSLRARCSAAALATATSSLCFAIMRASSSPLSVDMWSTSRRMTEGWGSFRVVSRPPRDGCSMR